MPPFGSQWWPVPILWRVRGPRRQWMPGTGTGPGYHAWCSRAAVTNSHPPPHFQRAPGALLASVLSTPVQTAKGHRELGVLFCGTNVILGLKGTDFLRWFLNCLKGYVPKSLWNEESSVGGLCSGGCEEGTGEALEGRVSVTLHMPLGLSQAVQRRLAPAGRVILAIPRWL